MKSSSKTMPKLFLRLFVIGCVVSIVLSFPQERQQQLVQRNGNPRSSRGFQIQNGKLSTARGFGKRGGGDNGFGPMQAQGFLAYGPDAIFPPNSESRSSYLNSWLAEEIQGNPESARYIIDKFVDENGDGEVSADELLRKSFL